MPAAPLADPSEPTVPVAAGTTVRNALIEAGVSLDGPDGAVVARDTQDGSLHDLSWSPVDKVVVEPVAARSPEGLAVIRHSAAHVMAQAVQDLFPGTLLGIGPPIENGFYYDFLPARPFTPDDLSAIEAKMSEIVKAGQRFERRPVTDDEARAELVGEPFKLELVGLKGAGTAEESVEVGVGGLTMYDNVDARTGDRVWTDLCRGPHVPTTRRIPAVKLMRSAAAYWRGSEANPQLQRIYGTAWATRDDLKAHLVQLDEAAKRDHRKLGAELDLFSFPDEIGPGLAVFHPKGGILRKTMEDYARQRHQEAGYDFVYTPHLTKAQLFETSGHLQWYAEGMYPPMHLDAEVDADGQVRRAGQDYYPKPMNCPMHITIYAARGRSYRELPLRLFEFGTVYRYEKSGVVHGLTRARGFTQDDSHIFCTPDQLAGELASLLDFSIGLLRDFGLTEFTAELSTRPEKFVGGIADWDRAEAALESALHAAGVAYHVARGEGAFYAPKIDVHVKDAIGRQWQLSTLQVDLQEPARFDLEYTAPDGSRQRPYMIHRALFGSIERFLGILVEHYAGAFPAWLSPVQVTAIPVSAEQNGYLADVVTSLRARGIRAELDDSDERMQKKIRSAQKQKVPFMLIAGGSDAQVGAVSFRYRDGTQRNGVPTGQAVDEIADVIARRVNSSPTSAEFG